MPCSDTGYNTVALAGARGMQIIPVKPTVSLERVKCQNRKKKKGKNSVRQQPLGLRYGVSEKPLLEGLIQILVEYIEISLSFPAQITFKPSRYSQQLEENTPT